MDDIAHGLEDVAALPDPVGETIESTVRPNGLEIAKIRVPLGTVFFIYESRPNVTADAAAICVKSGNAVILRGGKEARHSSAAIVDLLRSTATRLGLPEHSVQLVATTDRAAVGYFLKLNQYIDVAIPRGGAGLIRRVTSEASHAGDQALRRQLPRVRGCLGGSGDGLGHCRKCEVPAYGSLQRVRVAARARAAGRRFPAADRRDTALARSRDPRG